MTVEHLAAMPEHVRALRAPWPTLVGKVPDLNWELEQELRFGQRVTKTEQGYVLGGTIKGGSSSMWIPATRAQYDAFKRWQAKEGLRDGRDDAALERLTALLAPHGIALATRRQAPSPGRRHGDDEAPYAGYGPVYAEVDAILRALPPAHLARPALRRITLGGWGPDAAKASAYVDDGVHMYDFAVRGARRTFVGLFLHELGHAHERSLTEGQRAALEDAWRRLAEADAFVGVEYMLDANTRRLYQRFVFAEFVAETYMVYAACGAALRDTIEGAPAPVRDAWRSAYEALREGFEGVEYA